jgi:hypothetical protein
VQDVELKAGKFGAVRSLLRALEGGLAAKASLDCVLDACAAMQNLREAIAGYRARIFFEPNDIRRHSLLQVSLEYLERYYMLIVFAAYLSSPVFAPGQDGRHESFEGWWAARPELQSILLRLLRLNPVAALALDRRLPASGRQPVSTAGVGGSSLEAAASREDKDEEEEEGREERAEREALEAIVAQRAGSVLGPRTLLKLDHFPGCQSARLPAIIPGAPNFREVAGCRVFGGAIPTAGGIRSVLDRVGAGPGSDGQTAAIWHVMREEPVIYVNGAPYVLREEGRPFKNLMEYRGIDSDRLDQMESRLKVRRAILQRWVALFFLYCSADISFFILPLHRLFYIFIKQIDT